MNIEVLGHNKFMPLWFTLSVTSTKKLNALNYANILYETGLFESTEPAFMYHNLGNSNDPHFNDQWTLKNTGQNGGISGIDINIEQAWNISTGNNINVAVVDQGIEMNHPDLQANILIRIFSYSSCSWSGREQLWENIASVRPCTSASSLSDGGRVFPKKPSALCSKVLAA